MVKNIMIVGVGGQGALLASKTLGQVLLDAGFDVKAKVYTRFKQTLHGYNCHKVSPSPEKNLYDFFHLTLFLVTQMCSDDLRMS